MALTDFWEIKDNQGLAGATILNVWHVKRILAGANAQTIVDAFEFSILTLAFRSLQASVLTRSTIEVQNLGDPTDFVSSDSSAFPGTDTGSFMPTLTSATIQFNRTRTDMKNGQKRFAMGAETDYALGVWDAGFVAELAIIRDAILDPWKTAAAPLVDVCSFVILKRFCVVDGQSPCLKYRLPKTDTEIDDKHYVPLTGTIRQSVRSQVSRKTL